MSKRLKQDLENIGNPSLTLGISNYNATNAVRPFILEDMSGTDRENMSTAVKEFINQHKNFGTDGVPVHPDFTEFNDLPLAAVRTFPYANHVVGAGVYRRDRNSLPRYNPFNFAREFGYDAGKRIRRYFPENKFTWSVNPQLGPVWHTDYKWAWQEYRRKRIVVETKLKDHPEPLLLKNSGKDNMDLVYRATNTEPFIINDVVRPAGTLRFEDIDVEPIDTYSGRQFLVRYEFLYDPLTWFDFYVVSWQAKCSDLTDAAGNSPTTDDGCNSTSTYIWIYFEVKLDKNLIINQSAVGGGVQTTIRPVYEQFDFNGAFPTHADLKGYKGVADTGSNRPRIPNVGGYVPSA